MLMARDLLSHPQRSTGISTVELLEAVRISGPGDCHKVGVARLGGPRVAEVSGRHEPHLDRPREHFFLKGVTEERQDRSLVRAPSPLRLGWGGRGGGALFLCATAPLHGWLRCTQYLRADPFRLIDPVYADATALAPPLQRREPRAGLGQRRSVWRIPRAWSAWKGRSRRRDVRFCFRRTHDRSPSVRCHRRRPATWKAWGDAWRHAPDGHATDLRIAKAGRGTSGGLGMPQRTAPIPFYSDPFSKARIISAVNRATGHPSQTPDRRVDLDGNRRCSRGTGLNPSLTRRVCDDRSLKPRSWQPLCHSEPNLMVHVPKTSTS